MSIDTKKINIELQESEQGQYYIKALKIAADTIEEMERLTNLLVPRITIKLAQINREVLMGILDDILLNPQDMELFEHLRQIRSEISKLEDAPAYTVFPDKTLKLLATKRPRTKEEMLGLYGVGDIKYEKYGKRFIQAIADHEASSHPFLDVLKINVDTIEDMENALDSAYNEVSYKVSVTDKRITKKAEIIPEDLSQDDLKLYEHLRALRKQIAKEESLSDFYVFHNKTLMALAKIRPKTKEEMLEISGIGPRKYASYGERFMQVIEHYESYEPL